MEENKNTKPIDEPVNYRVHESMLARLDLINKRLFVLCIVIFLAFVGSNIGWLIYESQFEDCVTVTQDTPNGNNNYVGRDGSITNGAANNNESKTP